MKPILYYVDDDAHNLTVFEASLPDEWEIKTFSNPLKALETLDKDKPWVIVADQRMPGIKGVDFLEIAKKLTPHSVRIIVTGYSDEDLVIETVRKAQVFDYIRKPWDTDDLVARMQKAVEFYTMSREKEKLFETLLQREKELKTKNDELTTLSKQLEDSKKQEEGMRKELECWVPPFVLLALKENKIQFPAKRDLVCVTFDIINSNEIHGTEVNGRTLRSIVIQSFSESIIRHGGWRESHSGDSAYGHFGLIDGVGNPYEAALAVAREFRVSLRSLSMVHDVQIECGIALHVARDCTVDVHQVQLVTPSGVMTQKSFDTTSVGVDLVHRMEKLVHELKGTNIILSTAFYDQLEKPPKQANLLGAHLFKGQTEAVGLYLIASDLLSDEDIHAFAQKLTGPAENAEESGVVEKKVA